MTNSKTIIYVAVAIVVVLAIVVFIFARSQPPANSAEEVSRSLDQAVVETPTVAPNANPVRQVLPTENPIEKTNPFKNEYQNPFE